ncbi:ImmA/IrrE family metallo-endopeptidase [Novosphingobium sp. B1]|uniref:helix-turn-helix domain-containing protein n=1 Tax=Novosphingobium sp. B1 TaxID=1938756 RepID=UPI0009D8364A|nr:XRE family transcriptional regulator [Novosphingobium sp. B1]SMC34108.1 Zn-dependent peptidase ImmA, M78 family [Novosphingobium sp. B1]
MIGTRLKLARASAGLSLRDLAERMGNVVSAQAIGKYERNEDMPGSRALMALASALSVSESYLLSDEELTLEGVDFRKKRTAKEEATIEAQTLQLLERYLAIEDLLGLKSVEWEQPRSAPYPLHDIRDAEDAARSVREEWGLGHDPVPKLAELLEERGIKVLSLALDDIDGLAARVMRKERDAARVIVVRRNIWAERKRFTLAHELGHMVMTPTAEVDEERAAHRFAGAFLMPADVVRAEIGAQRSAISIGELVAIKERFGVSVQAIAYRCLDLGIIEKKAFSALFKEFTKRGWRKEPFAEPACIAPEYEEPKRFERLCYRALAEGVIGESRAAEMLGITLQALDQRLAEAV